MKFGSKKAIFGAIWGGFEEFGPCLGISHPTHPHLGKISQKNVFFASFPNLNLRIISLHTVPIYSESLRFDFYYLGWIFIIQGGSQGDGSLIVRFVLVPPVAISLKKPHHFSSRWMPRWVTTPSSRFKAHSTLARIGLGLVSNFSWCVCHRAQRGIFSTIYYFQAGNPNKQVKHWLLRHKIKAAAGFLVLLIITVVNPYFSDTLWLPL